MSKATPYLLFDGECAEAMTFYTSCLGAKLAITRVGDSPMKDQFPQNLQSKVINANLTFGDIEISASDWLFATRERKQGNTVCIYISGASYKDLRRYYEKLSVDADHKTLDPLQDMPFGTYGALTDKYGVRWMFQGDRKV